MTRPALGPAHLALVGLGALLALAACTSSARPWKVSPEERPRFAESRRACAMLTDDAEGMDRCLRRRGWRREYPLGL